MSQVSTYTKTVFNDAMATPNDARFIQQRLRYSFKDEKILLLALTAAGKGGTEDGIEKQGNSRLAHFGNYLMQFILAWVGFTNHHSRGERRLFNRTYENQSKSTRTNEL